MLPSFGITRHQRPNPLNRQPNRKRRPRSLPSLSQQLSLNPTTGSDQKQTFSPSHQGQERAGEISRIYINDEKYWVGDFPIAFLNIVMKALTES